VNEKAYSRTDRGTDDRRAEIRAGGMTRGQVDRLMAGRNVRETDYMVDSRLTNEPGFRIGHLSQTSTPTYSVITHIHRQKHT